MVAGLECCKLKQAEFDILHGVQKTIYRAMFGLRKKSTVLPLHFVAATPPPKVRILYSAFILLQSFAKNERTRVDVLRSVYRQGETGPNPTTLVHYLERKSEEYGLPTVRDMLFGPPWQDDELKAVVKARLLAVTEAELKAKCASMTTLRYLNLSLASLSASPTQSSPSSTRKGTSAKRR